MHLGIGNDSLRCEYCKTVVIVQKDDHGVRYLDETPELHCPVCAVSLWNATLAGIQLHACKQCSGLLVSMGAIDTLIDELRSTNTETQIPPPPDSHGLREKIDCPRCHQHMDVHFYFGGGGAVIGGCEHCELNWLDGGMLMRIVRAPHYNEAG